MGFRQRKLKKITELATVNYETKDMSGFAHLPLSLTVSGDGTLYIGSEKGIYTLNGTILNEIVQTESPVHSIASNNDNMIVALAGDSTLYCIKEQRVLYQTKNPFSGATFKDITKNNLGIFIIAGDTGVITLELLF